MLNHTKGHFLWCILFLFSVSLILSGCTGGEDSGLIDGDIDTESSNEDDTDGINADGDENLTDGDTGIDGDTEYSENSDTDDNNITDGDTDHHEDELEEEYEEDIERVTLDLVEGCNPFATSDACAFPFPISFYEKEDPNSPTGIRGNYPEGLLPNKNGSNHFDISIANLADGASPATPILLHFAADVDPSYLTPIENIEESISDDSPIAVFNMTTGKRIMFMSEMDMNRDLEESYPGRFSMIIRPMEPMTMGDRHIVVVKNGISDDEGNEFESPEAFLALRDKVYTTNEIIEDKRERYEEIFTFLENKGYHRNSIMLTWDFMIASKDWLLGSVISIRNEALNAFKTEELSYNIENIKNNPDGNTHMQVEGTFEVPNYLIPDTGDNNDSYTFQYDENHHPIRQPLNDSFLFTMLIPNSAVNSTEPLPLLIFGHGIFGSGREYLGWTSIRRLANENKVIILATDWIGLSSADYNIVLSEIIPDINRIGLVTDRLQQSFVNNIILTELGVGALGEDESIQVAQSALIDKEKVYYYGVSLGGIQGSSFVSLSSRIDKAIFAVPGSVWSNMLPRSNIWLDIKFFFDLEYPDPLIQQLAVAFMQTRFDHSDPINLTKMMFEYPLENTPENRRILIQESMEDCLVPNMTTEMLTRSLGVKLITPTQSEPFGIETINAPTTESALVQYYLTNQINNYVPPEENIPAEKNNGTHNKVATLPDVVSQIKHFLDYGEVKWFCDDVCTCEGVCTF